MIGAVRNGQPVSLYARALDDKRKPQHLYPATTTPPMPQVLWGLDDCRNEPETYLCEGILDALSLKTHGYKALAAS